MKTLMQKLIQLRNPDFRFDENITTPMLIQFMGIQFMAVFRGLFVFLYLKNPKGMMLGKSVSFFNPSGITWGRFLRLGNHVSVSALSINGVRFGNNVSIGAFSRIIVSTSLNNPGDKIVLGDNVGIGEFAYLGGGGGLEIGDECIVGQYFSCHPENHNCDDLNISIRHQGVSRKGIRIGSNCWIGSKVTILDGVEIGSGCVIAAGSVVTKSYPDNSIIGGVPAKILKNRNHEQ
ncbi:acyltransferase [Flavobacterium suzhouense]|uniref:Acyltransferase n=1 Tax=Flavobacterium suzhouense TaxID=1529638 RepID=A0ABW5NY00_9FLAO